MHLFSVQFVRWALCCPLLLLLLVSSRPALTQTIHYVKSAATGTGTGASWANASGDLQAMITASAVTDQVWVAGGVYKPGTVRTASFAMKNGVAIYGGFVGSETLLSQRVLTSPLSTTLSGEIGDPATTADNSYHVISNPVGLTTTAVLDGFLITGGRANGASYPAYCGGGMFNFGYNTGNNCSPVIRNCLFQANGATRGGAMYNDGSFSGKSSPVLTNCAFQSNTATDQGGAVFADAAVSGSSSSSLTNCSFQANSAPNGGGAIYISGPSGAPSLINCVVWGNGGVITFSGAASVITSYSFFESSVTGYTNGTGNLTATTSPFVSTTATQLYGCSPAVNAGDPATTTATVGFTDLAGNPRFYAGGRIDMGAYEYPGMSTPPARLYVRAGATGANTGLNWTDAFTDLQAALNYSCGGASTAEIWVATGVYKPTSTTNPSLSFAMRNGVTLYGSFSGSETALSQRVLTNPLSTTLSGEIGSPTSTTDNSYNVIRNPGGLTTSAVLDGFVITGGNASGSYPYAGGGMYNSGGSSSCSPVIRNCLFQANSATYGGAIYNDGYYGNSSPVLTNCAFQRNSATNQGGAIFNSGYSGTSSPILTNCSFQSNSAVQGGAIFNEGSYSDSNSPTLTNCSFQSNSAAQGGVMLNAGEFGVRTYPRLANCVVWGNGGVNTFVNTNYQAGIYTQYSLFEPSVTGYATGTGNLTATTSPLASTTATLLATGSAAINAGDPATTTATVGLTDLAGNPRFYAGSRIDMGAYEFQQMLVVFSLKNGSWTDTSLWSVGRLPQVGEKVRLKHSVTIPANYTALGSTLLYDPLGKLLYNSGGRLQLGQ